MSNYSDNFKSLLTGSGKTKSSKSGRSFFDKIKLIAVIVIVGILLVRTLSDISNDRSVKEAKNILSSVSSGTFFDLETSDVSEVTAEPTEPENSENSEPSETTSVSSGVFSKEDLLNLSYSGAAAVTVNDGVPYFTDDEITMTSFETYGSLDELGRCTTAFACIGPDLMPTEERGSISDVTPSGWNNRQYDSVDGGWLYNRCHLIGYQLTGENANAQNLITGTRYLNIDGMLWQENEVADYIRDTGNHVMYRVTPVYSGDELVCRGLLMEAYSVEDNGTGIEFCYYCFNVQPGITIDYTDGSSYETPDYDFSL